MNANEFNQQQLDNGKLTTEMVTEMVRAWQADHGLVVDGIAGPKTQATFESKEEDTEPNIPLAELVPKDLLNPMDIQNALSLLGYYDGDLDGDLSNPEFREDLKKFQSRMRISRDGVYGRQSEGKLQPLFNTLLDSVAAGGFPDFTHLNRWFLTFYYLAEETHYSGEKTIPVLSPAGEILDRVTPAMFAAMSLEDTGRMDDGRLLNVATNPRWLPMDGKTLEPVYKLAKRNGWIPKKPGYAGILLNSDGTAANRAHTFHVKDPGPLGYGVLRGIPLDPYKTLAADIGRLRRHDKRYKHHHNSLGKKGVVPPKTKVFILEFAGRRMPASPQHPTEWDHDGWFTVNDTGGGIFGAHFDVFTGSRALAKAVRPWPARAHIWYEGMEAHLIAGRDYDYGLQGH